MDSVANVTLGYWGYNTPELNVPDPIADLGVLAPGKNHFKYTSPEQGIVYSWRTFVTSHGGYNGAIFELESDARVKISVDNISGPDPLTGTLITKVDEYGDENHYEYRDPREARPRNWTLLDENGRAIGGENYNGLYKYYGFNSGDLEEGKYMWAWTPEGNRNPFPKIEWNLRIEVSGSVLFTQDSDDINFRNLDRLLQRALNQLMELTLEERDEKLSDALAGNDKVTLPDTEKSMEGLFLSDMKDLPSDSKFDSLRKGGVIYKFSGGDGEDTIYGGSAQNWLVGDSGGAFTDKLYGMGGGDLLIGGGGKDFIYGGGENDILYGDDLGPSGEDESSYSEGGRDSLYGGAGDDWLEGGAGVDHLYGGWNDDTMNGGPGGDTLRGGRGDDILSGGGLQGLPQDSGGNKIYGDAGEDTLYGWRVSDFSGAPNAPDKLWGGTGRDTFYVDTAPGTADVIMDFDLGETAYSATWADVRQYIIYSSDEGTKVNFFEGPEGGKVAGFEFETRILPQNLIVEAKGNLLSVSQSSTLSGTFARISKAAHAFEPALNSIVCHIFDALKGRALKEGAEFAAKKALPIILDQVVKSDAATKAVTTILEKFDEVFDRKLTPNQFEDLGEQIISNWSQIIASRVVDSLIKGDCGSSATQNSMYEAYKAVTLPLQFFSPKFKGAVQLGDKANFLIGAAIEAYFTSEDVTRLFQLPDDVKGSLDPTINMVGGNKISFIQREEDLSNKLGGKGSDDKLYSTTDVIKLPSNVENAQLLHESSERNAQSKPFVAGDIDEAKVLNGNASDNHLAGNQIGNKLKGLAGDDTIFGMEGRDVIKGGSGADILSGDRGNDTLSGNAGADLIEGGVGRDVLKGGAGHDELNGGAGHDRLNGGKGNDQLDGGKGNDRQFGKAGADTFHFSVGNDVLKGGAGRDVAFFDGNFDDYEVNFGKKVVVTEEDRGDRDRLHGVERIVFDDAIYAREQGQWVEII